MRFPLQWRGASRKAGASLEQKSYYFVWKINVFFENVIPAAMKSASREAPLETKHKNNNKNKRLEVVEEELKNAQWVNVSVLA